MKIRLASSHDKDFVLDFCKSTFSWGDYISDVWEYWISEGNLIVVEENNLPVGISHGSIIKNQQIWIEGIRVHEKYRNRDFAKKMIQELELIGKKNNCKNSMMLIETNNSISLNLAKSQNYQIIKKWNLFSTFPEFSKIKTNVKFVKNKSDLFDFLKSLHTYYIKSWRWLPLTKSAVSSLAKDKKIFYTEDKKISGVGIFEKSEHFANTVLLTLILSDKKNVDQLLIFFKNYALKMNWTRIQILCDLDLNTNTNSLERKYSFFLLQKNLS